MIGCTYALTTVVLVRSYSRHSCVMRCETETDTPGISLATISAARCSCAGSRYENRNAIATDSTPSAGERAGGRPDGGLVERHQHVARRRQPLRRPREQRPRGTSGSGRR